MYARAIFAAGILTVALFFAFDLPREIRESSYAPGVCKIVTYLPRTKYHCTVDQCTCRESWAPACSSVISFLEHNYDPANKKFPPGTPACSNGYKCCQTSCSKCRYCVDLDGEDCYFYDCNCYCSREVNNQACTAGCIVYYAADMVALLAHSNVSMRIHIPFEADETAASAHAARFAAGTVLPCYYRGDDILFDQTYTSWKWTVWGLLGVFPLLVSIGTHVAGHNSLSL